MHRLRSLSTKARHILLISKSYGQVVNDEIDRPTSLCCLITTQVQACDKMDLLTFHRLFSWSVHRILWFDVFSKGWRNTPQCAVRKPLCKALLTIYCISVQIFWILYKYQKLSPVEDAWTWYGGKNSFKESYMLLLQQWVYVDKEMTILAFSVFFSCIPNTLPNLVWQFFDIFLLLFFRELFLWLQVVKKDDNIVYKRSGIFEYHQFPVRQTMCGTGRSSLQELCILQYDVIV